MKRNKSTKSRSFSRLLINNYLIITLLMALAIGGVQLFTNYMLDRAFSRFDIEGMLEALEQSSSDSLSQTDLEHYLGATPFAQIYDKDGQKLFSSPSSSETLTQGLLELIPSNSEGPTASSLTFTGQGGETEYLLVIQSMDNQPDKFYHLDANYQVINASSDDRTSFTPEEMGLLFQSESDILDLTKLNYTNASGEERQLIVRYPIFDEVSYEKSLNWWRYSWFALAWLYIMMVSASVYWLNRKTKRLLEPLSQSIDSLASQQPMQIEYDGPKEFVELYDQFNELSEKLEHSESERQKLDANRNKMLTDISHDLKTPITVIQGYAQALHSQVIPPGEQDKYLQTIYQKSVHLTQLIDTFFEYSQLKHPNLILHRKVLNIYEFMQEYLAEKYQEIHLAGFQLDVSIPEDHIVRQSIDPIQFRRVFDNLISNSLKYNPKGTTITFQIRKTDALEMTYADDGTGLPEHLKDSLFDPFSVGDESRGKNGGTGLGLAITKRIIELHDGTIQLVQPPVEPFKTQFLIKLPIFE